MKQRAAVRLLHIVKHSDIWVVQHFLRDLRQKGKKLNESSTEKADYYPHLITNH